MEKSIVASHTKIVLIGGSAGSLEVLMQIVPRLTADPKTTLIIILHRKSSDDTTLEELFAMKTDIPVVEIEDKINLAPGNLYIAPANYHLLFEKNGKLSLDTSEKINYSRPSIDVSFESAADAFGDQVIGILLSGSNSDGTIGLQEIKNANGVTAVQNPTTAVMPFMPQHAIDHAHPDFILSIDEIVALISNAGTS